MRSKLFTTGATGWGTCGLRDRDSHASGRSGRLLLLVVGLCTGTLSAAAQNVVVGRCLSKLQSFPTIQAAVFAAPLGATVFVCPGTYPEQVTLSAPVTLEGVKSGTLNRAIIAVPANGLTTSTTTINGGYRLAAQVLVTAGTPSVNITNITVDGSGGNPPGDFLVGVVYDVGTSGMVNEVTIRNATSAIISVGIWAQNSIAANGNVTIENSSIHDVNFYGIYAVSTQTPPTLNATIRGNRISTSPVTGSGIGYETGGSIAGNVILAAFNGIELGGSSAEVTSNTMINTQQGIILYGPNTVKSNSIWNSSIAGIQLYGSGATVQNNDITQSVVGIEFSCSTGTVSGNTINDAGTGIDAVPSSFNLVNTLVNVNTTRTGVC